MALSLPVVVTNVVGIRDVVQDQVSGLIVPANAPAAMASAVLSLFRDSQRAGVLAATARRKVITEFAVEQMLDRHQALYEEVCARHAQARTPDE
jgi:glycosyltransferase involved in cell wall biosynthesis